MRKHTMLNRILACGLAVALFVSSPITAFADEISDDVNVAVGYNKIGGTTSKVLPFCVRNTLEYSASSDSTFTFELCYAQAGLKEKKQVAGAVNTNKNAIGPAGAVHTPTVNDEYVPVDYKLKNKDRVRIITDNLSFGPREDWIDKAQTSYAKRKIKEFSKK